MPLSTSGAHPAGDVTRRSTTALGRVAGSRFSGRCRAVAHSLKRGDAVQRRAPTVVHSRWPGVTWSRQRARTSWGAGRVATCNALLRRVRGAHGNGEPKIVARRRPGGRRCRWPAARSRRHAPKKTAPMTAQTLPDNPNYCFVPAYDVEDEVQQIRIVLKHMAVTSPRRSSRSPTTPSASGTNSTPDSDSGATTGPSLRRAPCGPRPPTPDDPSSCAACLPPAAFQLRAVRYHPIRSPGLNSAPEHAIRHQRSAPPAATRSRVVPGRGRGWWSGASRPLPEWPIQKRKGKSLRSLAVSL